MAAGCVCFEEELRSPVAPHRLFHALFDDAHNFMPKFMPRAVKSVDLVSGDGSAGSVQQINYADGGRFFFPHKDAGAHVLEFVKNRVDSVDKDKLEVQYTAIECDAFGDKVDHITNEVKFEAVPDGGCICKLKNTYYPTPGVVLDEEEIKAGRDNSHAVYKFVENFLIENPSIYA